MYFRTSFDVVVLSWTLGMPLPELMSKDSVAMHLNSLHLSLSPIVAAKLQP